MARKASGEFNQSKYINDFIKEKYDRINLTVPAGMKATIKSWAAQEGKSVNEYINGLIVQDLEKKGGVTTSAVCKQEELPEPAGFMETHKKDTQ